MYNLCTKYQQQQKAQKKKDAIDQLTVDSANVNPKCKIKVEQSINNGTKEAIKDAKFKLIFKFWCHLETHWVQLAI